MYLRHPKSFFINSTVVAASYTIHFKGTCKRFREHHDAESSEYWKKKLYYQGERQDYHLHRAGQGPKEQFEKAMEYMEDSHLWRGPN